MMPLGTVKSYMRRGLLQIRAALEGAVVDAAPPPKPVLTKRPFVVNLIALEEPPLAVSDRQYLAVEVNSPAATRKWSLRS